MNNDKVHARDLSRWKQKGRKIPMLTCYDYTMARILDRAGIPVLLVGDSLGQVVLGYESTLPVTLEDMIHHSRAVTRANPKGLVVSDMPFLSFQVSPEKAVEAAGRLIQAGRVDAVKLEGGGRSLEAISLITQAGIPVMGHLGLTPQSILAMGDYRVQGRSDEAGQLLKDDAKRLEDAGCFAIVLEMIPAPLAGQISKSIQIPTIGIGAGADCDGQVLVLNDMLGLFDDFQPKFVKRFLEGASLIENAMREYIKAVDSGQFPGVEHSFGLADKGDK